MTIKTAKGVINDITPSTIKVDGKVIYIPPEKREMVASKNLKKDEESAIVTYDEKGFLMTVDRDNTIPTQQPPQVLGTTPEPAKDMHIHKVTPVPPAFSYGGGGGEETIRPPDPDVHIQQNRPNDGPIVSSTNENSEMHKHNENPEPYDPALMLPILEYAVKTVNVYYAQSGDSLSGGKPLFYSISERCEKIEEVADRLYKFVKNGSVKNDIPKER
jgi:hypothetical protein